MVSTRPSTPCFPFTGNSFVNSDYLITMLTISAGHKLFRYLKTPSVRFHCTPSIWSSEFLKSRCVYETSEIAALQCEPLHQQYWTWNLRSQTFRITLMPVLKDMIPTMQMVSNPFQSPQIHMFFFFRNRPHRCHPLRLYWSFFFVFCTSGTQGSRRRPARLRRHQSRQRDGRFLFFLIPFLCPFLADLIPSHSHFPVSLICH